MKAAFKQRVVEYLTLDSVLFRFLLGFGLFVLARLAMLLGKRVKAFDILARLHRADLSKSAARSAESLVRTAVRAAHEQRPHWLVDELKRHAVEQVPIEKTAKYFPKPELMLGPIALVLKGYGDGEKGAINLHYSGYFPLFDKLMDIHRVMERYHLILEPSWSGFCEKDILTLARYKFPVFVQASEPRDARTIERFESNLIPTVTSANWWVDHRLFRPDPTAEKVFDVVMVAAWARYKRHHRYFDAIRRLKGQGRRIRTLLLGYKIDLTRDQVMEIAREYGVDDLVEAREGIPYEEMSAQVNSAKVKVLWSRREGVNRAVIECMFAGVPCIMRSGFNYGFPYPFMNPQTGRFADERTLPKAIVEMVDRYQEFRTRDWVMEHMSAQAGARALTTVIGEYSRKQGEKWTGSLVPKVTRVHNQEYWDPTDQDRFAADYEFLRSCARPAGQ